MSLPLFTVALKTFEGSQRRWCKKSIGAGRWTLSLCTDQMVTWTSLEVLWIVNSIRIDELQELIVLSIHWPQRKTPSKTASTAMRSLVTDRWRWSTGCTENCVLKTALSAPPSPQGRQVQAGFRLRSAVVSWLCRVPDFTCLFVSWFTNWWPMNQQKKHLLQTWWIVAFLGFLSSPSSTSFTLSHIKFFSLYSFSWNVFW